jgi:predicted ATPase/DNA-binding SARP family transcriptional activator
VFVELTLLPEVAYRGQEVTAPRLRALLALLAADLRTGASFGRLVDGLWPDEQPGNPTKAVHVLVSRARAQLGPDLITSTPTGYRLALGEDQVDASALLLCASISAKHARDGDHEAALSHAETGLALWDGGDSDPEGDPVSALRAERKPAYQSLVRARALALSRLGRHPEAVTPLVVLCEGRPRDEELLLELLRSEAATAGTSAALSRYDKYRRTLRDELGTDPGSALQELQQELLLGEVSVVQHGVLHEPNPLLGRADDIAAVAGLVRSARVTSIVGPGGLGKTRLAHAVSRQAGQRSVHFVALAGVTTDDDVASEVASELDVGESRRGFAVSAHLLPGIVAAVGRGPTLLVLDNCEHVVRGAAELVHALVSMTKDLRVLTTSRAPLGLSSESVYPLPELPLPTAVELFGQRAKAARPGADLPADVVAELCEHLDGLPLAVELAAARVRVMSVAEIAARLDDRFALLRGGSRDAPRRHHTLHAVVDWSWNLLDPASQAAMCVLSVFPGGFTAAAAEHVLGEDALQILEHLVDQSLLKALDTVSGVRFRMLETVREFSTAQREDDRSVDLFLAWARDFGLAHHESVLGAGSFSSVQQIRAEQDNLVLALRHGLDREDGPTVAATSAVLAALWFLESNYTRIRTLTDEVAWVLTRFRPGPEFVGATRMTATLCTVNTFMGQGPRATRSLFILRRLPPGNPDTLLSAASTVLTAGSEGTGQSAVYALCDSEEPLVAAIAGLIATYLHENDLDPEAAFKAARRALEMFDRRPIPWMQLVAHTRIAELSIHVNEPAVARRHLLVALRVLGPWPDTFGLRWALVLANLHLGALDEAEQWMELATQHANDNESNGDITFHLGVRAEITLARGEAEAGLRTWRRTVDLLDIECSEYRVESSGVDPWVAEVYAAAVVAHAQHGRLDLVTGFLGVLVDQLSWLLSNPVVKPTPFLMEFPVSGALLLALGMVDLDREPRRAARMIALAERFRFVRAFQPTMSPERARAAAEQADRLAYSDAVSEYASLGRDELRAAALRILRERG